MLEPINNREVYEVQREWGVGVGLINLEERLKAIKVKALGFLIEGRWLKEQEVSLNGRNKNKGTRKQRYRVHNVSNAGSTMTRRLKC